MWLRSFGSNWTTSSADREQSLSAEYFFLSGEYERAVESFGKKPLKTLSPSDADTYGWSLLMLGDRLHSAARVDDDKAKYRTAIKHFKVAAKIPSTSSDALFQLGQCLVRSFDGSEEQRCPPK